MVANLTGLCGQKFVDFLYHYSFENNTEQSVPDGTFNIYDKLENIKLLKIFLSAVEKNVSSLSLDERLVLFSNLLCLLEVQTLFPPVYAFHSISITGVNLLGKILDDVELHSIIQQQEECQKVETLNKLRELITKYESCISTFENNMPDFMPERNYKEGNKRLVAKLKRLSKLLKAA